jgi:alcohol oxidase
VRFIDIKTGRRSDTAHEYIYNQSDNTNLTVLAESRVIRVIIEYGYPRWSLYDFDQFFSRKGRAVGVEYVNENDSKGGRIVVKASRLVVVSAGAFGSPTILERSGVGSKKILDKNGITQIVDLRGVGENYMGIMQIIWKVAG